MGREKETEETERDQMKLPTNRERADWASIALDTYAETVNTPDEERELVLSGLLCDMMHYCEVEEIDWYQCVAWAQYHYREESAEELGLDAAVRAVVNGNDNTGENE